MQGKYVNPGRALNCRRRLVTMQCDAFFRQVLEYIARSLKPHGFRDVVFIGDSGPNQAGQIAVAATLNAEWAGGNTRVHAIPGYYRSDPEGDAAIMMARGISSLAIPWPCTW